MTDDVKPTPIFVFWVVCSDCDYETAAHGRVQCGKCGGRMKPAELAGSIVDDRKQP